jgi:hypothetical protein
MLLDELVARLTQLPEKSRTEAIDLAVKSTATMVWVQNPGPRHKLSFANPDELFYGGEAGGGKTDLGIGLANGFATLFRHKEPEFYLLFTTRRGGAEILNDQYANEAERNGVGVEMMERFPEQLFYKLDIIYTPDGAVPKLTPLWTASTAQSILEE